MEGLATSATGAARGYRAIALGGKEGASVTTRAQGILEVRSNEPLGDYPARLTDRLAYWAAHAPERTLVAARNPHGTWTEVSYRTMLERVRSIAGALAGRRLSAEHPIMILSGNDIDHLTLTLAAMWAGIPAAPVSPAYSLVSQDHSKLRHLVELMTPGMVFAAGPEYHRAIEAAVPPGVEIVLSQGALADRLNTRFENLCAGSPQAGDAAHAGVTADTIAKFLFTSGSTKSPKAVPNTHRMLCSNQQMILQTMPFLGKEPPLLVDWLPWNHTFGGNHNVGLVIYNGGTLYIDEGKPVPAQFGRTIANLREIAPTVYFNVPKGWEDLTLAMQGDPVLRSNLFSRVRLFFYAGAGLSQPVWDRLDALAKQTIGQKVRMITGLGMTETAPSAMFTTGERARAGHVGLPCPGCETKLVPIEGKLEVRFRGPHVMPGYWRALGQNAEAFDEEGYYRTGDALLPIDAAHPENGFLFDGRIAEDFKLSTGTFVSVGPLRAKIIAAGAPYVQDVVLAGLNRDTVAALLFPQPEALRRLAGGSAQTSLADAAGTPAVRRFFQELINGLYQDATGSAARISHALIATEPASLDRGEVTDKGSLNQRVVLRERAALFDALYDGQLAEAILPGIRR